MEYCLIGGNSNSTLSDRRVKMSRGSAWIKEETECLLDNWTDTQIKRMLDNTNKNASAFNTFSTSMREKEFDRSADSATETNQYQHNECSPLDIDDYLLS